MRSHCISLGFALFAAATFLGMVDDAAAAGLIPSAGEIVREGALLDGPCSTTPPPARDIHDPPNPDYMTATAPHPPVQPDLARLPAQWTAYRAVLNDMGWVVADLQAMVTAIERANGAYAATAKNSAADQWTQRQNQARYKAMDDAVDRVGDAENKLSEAQSELITAGIPQATVDS